MISIALPRTSLGAEAGVDATFDNVQSHANSEQGAPHPAYNNSEKLTLTYEKADTFDIKTAWRN